jgi:DNA gyrase subunit A
VNKANALEKILAVTQEKKALFAGVSDIRDESDRAGMRAVIEIKKDADAEKILQYLYKYSDLQTTFGVNMVAIAGGKPVQMGLKELIRHYIRHQRNVVTRRTKFDLENAKKREHILAGLMVAISNIDEVIALIRASKTPAAARTALMQRFSLTEIQAQAILDLRLQRLTNLEMEAIQREYAEILKKIAELEGILGSDRKLVAVIKKELLAVKKEFSTPRRTQLIDGQKEITIAPDELKAVDDAVVLLLPEMKIRRVSARLYQPQAFAAETPVKVFRTRTDKKLRLFTNHGACL